MLMNAFSTERQDKVISNIRHSLGGRPSNKHHNDEYAIGVKDIYDELIYWASLKKFRGKNIICPCDCDIIDDNNVYAIEIIYNDTTTNDDAMNCTVEIYRCNENKQIISEIIPDDEVEDFIYNKLKCGFLRTLTQHAEDWGIKSITASGYDTERSMGFPYEQIDFGMYDVCITNPPPRLYSHFVKHILNKIDFLIVSPFISRGHTIPMLPLMNKEAYLGKGRRIRPNFVNRKLGDKDVRKDLCCDWLVSYPEAQAEIDATRYSTGVKYSIYEDTYPVMDNMTMRDGSHPIKINNINVLPDDYNGWMMCAAGILDRLSNEEFEWYPTQCATYFNANPDKNPYAHKVSSSMLKVGWKDGYVFDGVVVRRRSTSPST